MLSPYILNLIVLIAIYGILAMALSFVIGHGGVLQFGHVALFGVGAYASAILTTTYSFSFSIGFLGAMAFGGIGACMLGMLIRRVRGDFMALTTFFFAFAFYALVLNVPELTRGALGIPAIARPSIVMSLPSYAIASVVTLVVVYLLLTRILHSPFGLVMGAMRDDELGARVLGKNTAHVQRVALVLSGMIAGLAGALYAHYIGFIDPSSFYLGDLVIIVAAVVIGGLGSLPGSVIGIAIYFLIPEVLRFINIPTETFGAVRQIIFITVLLLIILVRPKGILGKVLLDT
ncbi:MAG: branched-chain amino acid ABC transporter permease [bacterium]|nr:branched-chain amino acid ABC transporter permease [bacterium]